MDSIKHLFSQQFINNFYHLPKAVLANIFYGFPTNRLKVIGITGTDGKTTTTSMIYQILKDAGKKVSMVSTINSPGLHVTSPNSFTIQKIAKESVKKGDEYLVLEVTSHALDQFRFWGIKFDIGVITNITHEHLDYHKTFANYSRTKLSLLKDVKYAVINENLLNRSRLESPLDFLQSGMTQGVTFGLEKGDFNQKDLNLKLKIPGDYNIENGLAALAVAFNLGIDKNKAQKTLENFSNLKGRMEEIKNNKGLRIFVDFAHTPNALEQALKTLRKDTAGRLIALFGCAGKRDFKKRKMMGEVAKKLADFVIITSEDPRGELKEINYQIIKGVEKSGGVLNRNFFVEDDRGKAVNFAINILSKKGDTIGIFGKGHETSMNLDGKTEVAFSDFDAVNKALNG